MTRDAGMSRGADSIGINNLPPQPLSAKMVAKAVNQTADVIGLPTCLIEGKRPTKQSCLFLEGIVRERTNRSD